MAQFFGDLSQNKNVLSLSHLYEDHMITFWIFPTIKEVDVEEDDRPKEVPIFDQTMSILQMIKDKKVCLLFNFPDF